MFRGLQVAVLTALGLSVTGCVAQAQNHPKAARAVPGWDSCAEAMPARTPKQIVFGRAHQGTFGGSGHAGNAVAPAPADYEIPAEIGRPITLSLDISDLDGQNRTLEVEGLPLGAALDPVARTLRWCPGPDQLGTHAMRIVARAEGSLDARTVNVIVKRNSAPVVSQADLVLFLEPRYRHNSDTSLLVSDPEDDPVQVTLGALPAGVGFEPQSSRFYLKNGDAKEGNYSVRVVASDGTLTSEVRVSLRLQYRDRGFEAPFRRNLPRNWAARLLPGAGFAFQSAGSDENASLLGPSVEVLLAAWVRSNAGPSHGRFYLKTEFLLSLGSSDALTIAYAFGADFSVEGKPNRDWLVPIVGAEFGGLERAGLGHLFQTTPYVGLHIWSSRRVIVNARGGRRFLPFEGDGYSVWHAAATVDLRLW